MKSLLKQTLIAGALMGTLMACGVGYASTPAKTQTVAVNHAAKKTAVQLLFVLSAQSGRITRINHGYQLTLNYVDPHVLWFTDRPERKAGLTPLTNFLDSWAKGFASSPPNAALVHVGMEPKVVGKNQPIVVELSKPHYQMGTLTFKVAVLKGERISMGEMKKISLFLDTQQDDGYLPDRVVLYGDDFKSTAQRPDNALPPSSGCKGPCLTCYNNALEWCVSYPESTLNGFPGCGRTNAQWEAYCKKNL